MDSIVQKFKNIFLEEAQELIDSYESDLLKLEQDPGLKDIIESAFRSMHTLKGISSMYGFDYISEITHKLEQIFQEVRDGHQSFTKELFDITFSVVDHLRKLLFDENLSDPELNAEHKNLIELINKSCGKECKDNLLKLPDNSTKATSGNQSLWQIKLQATEKQYFRGISFMNILRELADIGLFAIEKIHPVQDTNNEIWGITLLTNADEDKIRDVFLFIEDDCNFTHLADFTEEYLNNIKNGKSEPSNELTILESVLPATKPQKVGKTTPEQPVTSTPHDLKRISVAATKLDYLMFLVSELITVNSQVALSMKQNNIETLKTNLEKIDTLSKNFRNNALELRLVPLNDLVLRFQRLIRDLSKQLGKKVELKVFGAECELDKSTIEQLSDPLMHIIRNCIDHGIETPEQRIKHGKPETGVLKLSAHHSGGKVVITIEDDGNGVDLEKVKNKAINLGLLSQESEVTKKELLDFIFMPGFSTAQSLTNVSGRGVGMDVVRKKIQELRGDVTVETHDKIGTSFVLSLQQSVSIIDTLLFSVENSYFTLPVSEINICSDIKNYELEQMRHTCVLPYGDLLIPFVDLRLELSVKGQYPPKVKLIIVKCENRYIAILADKIIGEHQAVLKPISRNVQANKLLSSVSQLGDGNMAFMIDTHELVMKMKVTTVNK